MEGARPQPEKKRMIYVAAGTALLAVALTTGLAIKAGVERVMSATFYVDQQVGGCTVFVVNMPDKVSWDDAWGDVTRHAELSCLLPTDNRVQIEAYQTLTDPLSGEVAIKNTQK